MLDDSLPRIDRSTRPRTWEETEAFCRANNLPGPSPLLKPLFCQPFFEQGTDAWLESRKHVLTASHVGPACGKGGTAASLFRKKCERVPPKDLSGVPAICHGNHYEDVAVHRFEEITGLRIVDFGLLGNHRLWQLWPGEERCSAVEWDRLLNASERNPDYFTEEQWEMIEHLRWVKGSPDGITTDGAVIEVKCPYSRLDVDSPIRPNYMWQILTNMCIAGTDMGYFIRYQPERAGRPETCNIIPVRIFRPGTSYCIGPKEAVRVTVQGARFQLVDLDAGTTSDWYSNTADVTVPAGALVRLERSPQVVTYISATLRDGTTQRIAVAPSNWFEEMLTAARPTWEAILSYRRDQVIPPLFENTYRHAEDGVHFEPVRRKRPAVKRQELEVAMIDAWRRGDDPMCSAVIESVRSNHQ